ncbi:hypothetical protein L249_7853 [Ophiocordyceps polyrhachis-furcata BCC 54312]|uniref:Uncharacterized protein n=1 Tax=Ophiocordyceps polyrhachis-furcata BCC 54312 TaxID=1330021 RepID=A0A367L0L6_9HYPO|nr:hypothetical protein L249_7853 [Ophiocordyceps polyrhachis-furcata BCC 54312]
MQEIQYRPTRPIFGLSSVSESQRIDDYSAILNSLSLGPQNATTRQLQQVANQRREKLLSKIKSTEQTSINYIELVSEKGSDLINPYAKFPSAASIDDELARPGDVGGLSHSTVRWMVNFLEHKRIPETDRAFPRWFSNASYYLCSAQLASRPDAPPRHSPEKEKIGQSVLKCNQHELKQLSLEGITGSWVRLLCPQGGGACCNAIEAWSWAMILADEASDTSGTWVSETAAETIFMETTLGSMPGGVAEAALWTIDHVACRCPTAEKPTDFPSDAEAMACRLLNAGLYATFYTLAQSGVSSDELSAYYRSARASVLINDLIDYASDVAHGQANLLAHCYAAGRRDFALYVYSCLLGDFHQLFVTAETSLRRPLAAFLFIWAMQFGSQRYPQYHDKVLPSGLQAPTVRVCRQTNFGDFSWDDVLPLGSWVRSRYTDRPPVQWGMGQWQDAITRVYFAAIAAGHGRLTGDWPAWADTLLHLFVDSVDLGLMVAVFTPTDDILSSQ